LEQLQEQFRNVQKEDAAYRLSDRNCVEILIKLQEIEWQGICHS